MSEGGGREGGREGGRTVVKEEEREGGKERERKRGRESDKKGGEIGMGTLSLLTGVSNIRATSRATFP